MIILKLLKIQVAQDVNFVKMFLNLFVLTILLHQLFINVLKSNIKFQCYCHFYYFIPPPSSHQTLALTIFLSYLINSFYCVQEVSALFTADKKIRKKSYFFTNARQHNVAFHSSRSNQDCHLVFKN